jgi:hypothetical protein
MKLRLLKPRTLADVLTAFEMRVLLDMREDKGLEAFMEHLYSLVVPKRGNQPGFMLVNPLLN